MKFTEDQILQLAPDEPSKKAGKDLANPAKWVSKGASEEALWGECQGSGSKPYQTQIDRNNMAFKCSCPSRKFPCKHGLGLLLLYARRPDTFTDKTMPPWVAEWITKRTGKAETRAASKEKPVDEEAQAKRLKAREQKVSAGIEELLLWIKDVVRNGIVGMPEKGYNYWEGVARRMVDAQAPGLAGMVKNLGQTGFFAEGWQSGFLDQLLNIYLIINGYKNIGKLPPLSQQDIRDRIGFTRRQEELKEQQGVTDTWLVLAKQASEEDNLTIERYWLHGLQSSRPALVLQFLARGQGAPTQLALMPGMCIQAELVFYPSVAPLRALIKRQSNAAAAAAAMPQKMFAHWKEVTDNESAQFAQMPVRGERPYIVENLRPVRNGKHWWLHDANGHLMPLKDDFKNIWKLLAISGGHPLNMAVLGRENAYEPIGAWHRNQYKSL